MKSLNVTPIRFTALLATVFLALSASAETSLSHADKSFIEKAAKCSTGEADISRVIADRTQNPAVRTFAQKMVDDHGSANKALATLAASKGVELPAKDMADANKWSSKSGKGLDEDYMDKMVSDHKDAVELFQKEADKGEDAETKAFARDTLPTLQHHLEMALDLEKTLK
jgi:putative membrane protein